MNRKWEGFSHRRIANKQKTYRIFFWRAIVSRQNKILYAFVPNNLPFSSVLQKR